MDQFTYLSSNISSTESDVSMCSTKAWDAIDRLSIIWKSNQSDKIKWDFFQVVVMSILLYGCTTWMLRKHIEENLDENYTRTLRAVLNKSWQQHPTNSSCIVTCFLSDKLFKIKKMWDTAGEVRTNL